MKIPLLFLFAALCPPVTSHAADLLFPNSDFEAGTLENWTAAGSAFTRQPTFGDNTAVRGNVPSGRQGDHWVGTFENYDGITGTPGATRGDGATGTLTSQPFTLTRRYLHFLIGGGRHTATTGVKLVCEGQEYLMATGIDSESMVPVAYDAGALLGKTARVVIFDQETGGWGHINADDFRASDEADPERFRLLPGIPAADAPATGYDQPLRPQFHFTSRRNWLNDPNGMVFDGEHYHLFFQHNPLGTGWGNMTWGHAISSDMVRWRQLGHALRPYQVDGRSGTIYSGTVVVDHNNSLGLQQGPRKTLAAFFTYAASPFDQALAHSTDGGVTWQYHNSGRAVVPNQGFDAGERDPKVFWHEPSGRWVMALWVQLNPGRIRFFTSPNLKDWTFASDLMRDWAFECVDLFPLPVDGNPAATKWVLYDASFDYEIGSFDGTTFTTEAGPFQPVTGNFYAAQSFNQAPAGRVVQIGWMNGGPDSAAAYGLPFNQQMAFPCDLTLRTTPAGVRLCANPVPEIASLATTTWQADARPLTTANLIAGIGPLDLVDLTLEFEPGTAPEVVIDLPRTSIRYTAASQTLGFLDTNGNLSPLVAGAVAPRNGRIRLRLLLDRLSLEAYVFDGERFGAHYLNPANGTATPSIRTTAGQAYVRTLSIASLKSSWEPETPLAAQLANPGFEEGNPSGAVYQQTAPGWKCFEESAGTVGRWDNSDGTLDAAAGYPPFTGSGAAALGAGAPSRGGWFQSLGRVALADLGGTFTLGAEFGARVAQGATPAAGELRVSFRKGVTAGISGDAGTLLGTAGTLDAATLPAAAMTRASARFTPALEDVGTEVFAVIDLDHGAAGGSWLADEVTLSVVRPDPRSGPLAYEGFAPPAGTPLAKTSGGSGWRGSWIPVTNGGADIVSGSLAAAARAPAGYDAASTGNRCSLPNARRIGRFLDTSPAGPFAARGLVDANGRIGKDGSTLYLSFLQQPNGTSNFYEFEFHRGDLGDPGRIAGIGNDQAGTNVHLRAPANVHTLIGPGDTGVNFYVVRIDFKAGNDDIRIWRNPAAASEPGTPTLTKLAAADLSFDGISFGAFLGDRSVVHDELRFGTSWAQVSAEPPYLTWQREAGLSGGDGEFSADPDHDSIPNGLEWLSGGDPRAFDAGINGVRQPDGSFEFSFPLQPGDHGGATLAVQWTADLAGGWNTQPVPAGGGSFPNGVVIQRDASSVRVRLPATLARSGRLFARLLATLP